jgi:hypothetical protein
MPVVIMQNLYPNKGVCNDSRMVIVEIGKGHLLGCLLSVPFKGDEVMVPTAQQLHYT